MHETLHAPVGDIFAMCSEDIGTSSSEKSLKRGWVHSIVRPLGLVLSLYISLIPSFLHFSLLLSLARAAGSRVAANEDTASKDDGTCSPPKQRSEGTLLLRYFPVLRYARPQESMTMLAKWFKVRLPYTGEKIEGAVAEVRAVSADPLPSLP